MKTDPNDSVHPIVQSNFNYESNQSSMEVSDSGLTKREHIMIEMQKAVIIGIYGSTPKGEHHGWSYETMANEALYHTDACINALNNNP